MKATLLVAAAAAAVAAGEAPPTPVAPAASTEARSVPAARLPGFAAQLSEQPVIDGAAAWTIIPEEKAWAALARAGVDTRQAARWTYARSLLGRGLSADAFGVLQVMGQDDPDLALIDSYRLARGAALAGMGRSAHALEALVGPGLAGNAEACAWRLLVLAKEKLSREALQQLSCAQPALQARPLGSRAPFLLAAAGAALHAGKPELTIRWLRPLGKSSAAADLLLARAYQALGRSKDARLALSRAIKNGNLEQRLDAEVTEIEAAVQARSMPPAQALKRLERIRYVWRGGEVEERALRLSYRIGSALGDLRTALSAGSALFSYFDLGADGGQVMAGLQKHLAAALDPSSRMPLDEALGLYWDFRHLTPMGAEGDLLVSRLGERLQTAGLYARAADLFEHQLFARAKDLAQGPLSAKVARLHILAGRPQRALEAIRRTTAIPYPVEMRWERHRVEAVALAQLGRTEEALAALEAVPDSGALRTEILWKKRDWSGVAAALQPTLPQGGGMSEVTQANVLRYAIALAMLGREADLETLRNRYEPAFAQLPSGAAFEALTATTGTIDVEGLTKALASIPSASAAGDFADLLEVRPTVGS